MVQEFHHGISKTRFMKNIYFILLIIFLMGVNVYAQTTSTLKGRVTDSSGQPVIAATVSVSVPEGNKIIKFSTTDKTGSFEINNLKDGIYELTISAVGFKEFKKKPVTVQNGDQKEEQHIQLSPLGTELKNVTVTAKKPMVEVKADKTIVNVESFITNAGSNALEVLEKSPGVTVDRDGNISLKGKQGVIILVDGKQTYLSGPDLANLLRNTPSNQLETLEIMTQPSAKYDASGNSGIINIKTKKGRQNGFNGSVNLSYVQAVYPKSPNSLNLNYKKNKVNLFTTLNYSYWQGFSEVDIVRNFSEKDGNGLLAVFDQHSSMRFKGQNMSSRIGMDYSIDKRTTLGFQVYGTYNPRTFQAGGIANIYDGKQILDSTNEALSTNKDPWKNLGTNLNFRKQLDTAGRELTADLDYIYYKSRSKQTSDNYTYYQPQNQLVDSFLLRGYLPSDIKIYSAKLDYVHPLGKAGRIEAGFKSSLVKTDNDAQYTNWDAEENAWINDTTRSNHFLYDENINAVYVNYNREFNKWSLQTGLRYEHTSSKGEQLARKDEFKRNYGQLFPTIFLSYSLNDKNKFSASYGRRIERPNYQDMNPFQYFLDQYTYRQGNPYLLPQISNNIELSHNFKSVLNTTLNYTVTSDIINDVLKQNDSTKVTFQTKENIARRTNIGIAISYNQAITKWWSVSAFGNVFSNSFKGIVNGENLDAMLISFLGNINNQFKIGKTWGAEASGFYRSKMQDGGLIIAEPMGVVSFGFSKQILKTKGTIKLALNDPFYIQKFRGYTKFGAIDTRIYARWDNRRVGLTFTYRFGSNQQAGPQRRKTGSAAEEQNRVGGGNQQ
jgi:outer membrane receptor protein involved in Fe transport